MPAFQVSPLRSLRLKALHGGILLVLRPHKRRSRSMTQLHLGSGVSPKYPWRLSSSNSSKEVNVSDKISEHIDQDDLDGIGNANDASIGGLLSHTAGIESWEDDLNWIAEARGKKLDRKTIWGKKGTLEYVRRPSRLETSHFPSSYTNYTLLDLIIEKITGHSAESEIRQIILDPLNLMDKITFLEEFEEVGLQKENVTHRYHYATDTFSNTARVYPSFSGYKWKGLDLIDAIA